MKRFIPILALLVLAGCGGCGAQTDLRPQALCLQAAGAYRPVQLIAAAALHTDKLPASAVTKIQVVDAEANKAAHVCRDSTTNADIAYSTGVLTGAALQLPPLTNPAPAPTGGK